MTYAFAVERGDINYPEIEPLYRMHYAEMQARLAGEGVAIGPYNPRLDVYFARFADGGLRNYVVRCDGKVVGYSNIYVTLDMHNQEPIASEDTIYVHPAHRNGVGRKLVLFLLHDLRNMGIKRGHVAAMTDLRVEKLWKRMGFKSVATQMIYRF